MLTHLGLPAPADSNQKSFDQMIEALENRGYEIATVDGARLTPVGGAFRGRRSEELASGAGGAVGTCSRSATPF